MVIVVLFSSRYVLKKLRCWHPITTCIIWQMDWLLGSAANISDLNENYECEITSSQQPVITVLFKTKVLYSKWWENNIDKCVINYFPMTDLIFLSIQFFLHYPNIWLQQYLFSLKIGMHSFKKEKKVFMYRMTVSNGNIFIWSASNTFNIFATPSPSNHFQMCLLLSNLSPSISCYSWSL